MLFLWHPSEIEWFPFAGEEIGASKRLNNSRPHYCLTHGPWILVHVCSSFSISRTLPRLKTQHTRLFSKNYHQARSRQPEANESSTWHRNARDEITEYSEEVRDDSRDPMEEWGEALGNQPGFRVQDGVQQDILGRWLSSVDMVMWLVALGNSEQVLGLQGKSSQNNRKKKFAFENVRDQRDQVSEFAFTFVGN